VTDPAHNDGAYVFEVRAIAPSGEIDPSPERRYFTVDTVPPDTEVTGGPSGTVDDPQSVFFFRGSGSALGFECRVDADAFKPCAGSDFHRTAVLAEGPHRFEVRAFDSAGNVDASPAARDFTVDPHAQDPPSARIVSGPAAVGADPTPRFQFGADAEVSGYLCDLDDAGFETCAGPGGTWEPAPLSHGPHEVVVQAVGPKGEAGGQTDSHEFVVDLEPPETSAFGPLGVTFNPQPRFSLVSSGGDGRFECRADLGAWKPCAGTFNWPTRLADGAHRVEVRALDAANNRDATPAVVVFEVDTVLPDTRIEEVRPPSAGKGPVVSLSATEPRVTFRCSLNGSPYTPCSTPFSLRGVTPGRHELRAKATDRAGRSDPTAALYSFKVPRQRR
jgi:hypothetical protein